MEFAILSAIIIAIVTVMIIWDKVQRNKNLKARLQNNFGKIPDQELNLNTIKKYKTLKGGGMIDEITWHDLDMDKVFTRINACQSSVGEEYLYDCLHNPQFSEDTLQKREERIDFFAKNEEARFQAQLALARLGKDDFNGIALLIFGENVRLLPYSLMYKILAFMPIVFAVTSVFSLLAGAIGLLLSFIVNLIVHHKSMAVMETEYPAISYFGAMMVCYKRLINLGHLDEGLEYKIFKKVISKAPVKKAGTSSDLADAVWQYFTVMFLYDVRHYNKFITLIMQNNDDFHKIYRTLGETDMAIAVLNFRKSLPAFCLPQFNNENALDFEEIFHPLITEPVTNTQKIERDSLITGSNASGKSTFIKTLAINGILAQTIYTCTAKRFATRFSLVITSMAMRDDILAGESYFIVEIKSLKRILTAIENHPCTCYIDEILRGTNTTERVAASAAILQFLNKKDILCIAATHDIELTRILPHKNYHFCETVTDGGITFDYKLKQGASKTRNAIKLLEAMGFEPEIVENANRLAYTE
ncbi:MAG: hypothetical protein FWB80_15350 [Defluviitaleaceae bacterium]|nr:hypothetical protein [Defluviitaleaceae bacterium]MCL2200286.1 hypothetical protein [Defluviitaleaceae bacterium]